MSNAGEIVHSGTTPVFTPSDADNAVQTTSEAAKWRAAGRRFAGGTLKGLQSKMGYMKRLGSTIVRISPDLKQSHAQETYTGNGIQNFLTVEPRFGTPEAFREVVATAHTHGLYVILDIILNHVGDVFVYQAGQPNYHQGDMPHPVMGYRDQHVSKPVRDWFRRFQFHG
ncbi:alpha-amylase family glycosyl hydrolase [Larkinella sp. GY13]|uniref:alpha-amylase family glycosyl hydrolase n=1 Tax=Larkinella sp. GY13 TaxID=3453720 RepID=UPI003EEA3BC5